MRCAGKLGFEALGDAKPNVPYKPTTIVHVELDDPGTLVVEGEGVDVASFAFEWARCGRCAPMPMPMPSGVYGDLSSCTVEQPCNPIALELQLEPGRYAFLFEQYPDEPPLRLRLAATP